MEVQLVGEESFLKRHHWFCEVLFFAKLQTNLGNIGGSVNVVPFDIQNRKSSLKGPRIHDSFDTHGLRQSSISVTLFSQEMPKVILIRILELPMKKSEWKTFFNHFNFNTYK